MIDLDRRQSQKKATSLSCVNVFIIATELDFICELFDDSQSKSLLKVLNKNLLAYQLEYLERQGIKEVFIITNKKYDESTSDYISNQYIGDIKAEIIIAKNNIEQVSLFSILKSKVTKSNFIIMSGDSILNFNLNLLIDTHIFDKSLVSLILNEDIHKYTNQRMKFNQEALLQIFGIDKKNNDYLSQLVYSYKKDPNDSSEPLFIHKSTLKHASSFQLLYNYEDIHFYLFNSNIFSLIDNEEIRQMPSIKNNFIPYLINKSFSHKLNTQLKERMKENCLLADRVIIKCHIITKEEFAYRITNYSKLLNTIGEIQKNYEDIKDVFFQTKNNTKHLFSNFASAIQANVDNNKQFCEGIQHIESISMDSYVSDPVISIGKKCRVNKTVTGINLTVQEGTKVTNCLLFNNIKIGKDCKITNSILGDNVIIEDNCSITDCVLQKNYFAKSKTEIAGEILSE